MHCALCIRLNNSPLVCTIFGAPWPSSTKNIPPNADVDGKQNRVYIYTFSCSKHASIYEAENNVYSTLPLLEFQNAKRRHEYSTFDCDGIQFIRLVCLCRDGTMQQLWIEVLSTSTTTIPFNLVLIPFATRLMISVMTGVEFRTNLYIIRTIDSPSIKTITNTPLTELNPKIISKCNRKHYHGSFKCYFR